MSGDGMGTMVTALMTGDNAITASNLWSSAAAAAPLIGTLFAFAFGYFILKKVLKKGQHGRAGI